LPACHAAFDAIDQRVPAGSMESCRSTDGIHDLNGNVNAWVYLPNGKSPHRSGLKGGSWGPVRDRCRPTVTFHDEGDFGYEAGFRCCCALRLVAPLSLSARSRGASSSRASTSRPITGAQRRVEIASLKGQIGEVPLGDRQRERHHEEHRRERGVLEAFLHRGGMMVASVHVRASGSLEICIGLVVDPRERAGQLRGTKDVDGCPEAPERRAGSGGWAERAAHGAASHRMKGTGGQHPTVSKIRPLGERM
jgi:hypothetical protein